MNLKIYTDGASSGNPGPGWAMWVVCLPKGNRERRVRLAHCTNNEAEYLALINALKDLHEHPDFYRDAQEVMFHLDSSLVVQQVNGAWKIKEPRMAMYVQEVHMLSQQLNIPVRFVYIPRAQNIADKLKFHPE